MTTKTWYVLIEKGSKDAKNPIAAKAFELDLDRYSNKQKAIEDFQQSTVQPWIDSHGKKDQFDVAIMSDETAQQMNLKETS